MPIEKLGIIQVKGEDLFLSIDRFRIIFHNDVKGISIKNCPRDIFKVLEFSNNKEEAISKPIEKMKVICNDLQRGIDKQEIKILGVIVHIKLEVKELGEDDVN